MSNSIVLGTISLNDMAGGLEKNIVLLANHLAEKGLNVNLVSFDYPDSGAFFEIDSRVQWFRVGNSQPHAPISFRKRLQMIHNIRRILRRLHDPIIICFHHGILFRFLAASVFLGTKIVCSERNSLTLYRFIRQNKWSLNFLLLAFVHRITVQFCAYVNDYPFWLRKKMNVIPNPVFPTTRRAQPHIANKKGRFSILTVGRLCAQKNQRALIMAFSSLSAHYPEWDLHIVGDGSAYEELRDVIIASGLQHRIFLKGKVKDVTSWFACSHIFCLPSQWEGFPNALAEAMSFGLPSVGYSACAGVRDLISHGETGLLADSAGLPDALEALMASSQLRRDLGAAAACSIKKYAPRMVFSSWERLLYGLAD